MKYKPFLNVLNILQIIIVILNIKYHTKSWNRQVVDSATMFATDSKLHGHFTRTICRSRYFLFNFICLYIKISAGESDWRSGHQSRLSGSNPGLRTWIKICRSQSGAEDVSLGTPFFISLQIRLLRQDLSSRAIKH